MTIIRTPTLGALSDEHAAEDQRYAGVDISDGLGMYKCYIYQGPQDDGVLVNCPQPHWDSESGTTAKTGHTIVTLEGQPDGWPLIVALTTKINEYDLDHAEYHANYPSQGLPDAAVAATAVKCVVSAPTEEEFDAAIADLTDHHDKILAAAKGVEDLRSRTTSITSQLVDDNGDLKFPEVYTVVDPGNPANILTNQTEVEYAGAIARGDDTGYTGEVMLLSYVQKGSDTWGLYPMRYPQEDSVVGLVSGTEYIREGISYSGRWGSESEAAFDFYGQLDAGLQEQAAAVFGGSTDNLSIAYELYSYQPKEFRPVFYSDTAQSLIGPDGNLAFLYPNFPLKMTAANDPAGYLVNTAAGPAIATQMMLGRDAAVEYKNILSATVEGDTANALHTALDKYIAAMQAWIDTAKVLSCALRMNKYDKSQQAKQAEAWSDLKTNWGEDPGTGIAEAIARFTLEAQTASLTEIGTEHVPPFFREQCFLLTEMPWFSAYKKRELEANLERKRLPYITDSENNPAGEYNACLQMDGEPFGFMNRLTQYPGYANIASMKTSEIANLQPLIRLFKILVDKDGKESQLEIPFDSYFTKNDLELFRNKASRGVGVGIQDFTFSYEADNPFAVKKSIKAKLTMFANNFTELLRARYVDVNGSAEEFKYVDLALKTGVAKSFSVGSLNPKEADVIVANLDKLRFRLKAVIGWNYRDAWGTPNSDAYELNTLSPKVRTALYDSFITLSLTPTVHEFDIDDQGRVKFSINYLAYVEDFYDQPAFNIFPDVKVGQGLLTKEGIRHPMEWHTEQARTYRDLVTQLFAANCKSEEMSILKEELASDVEVYRQESLAGIVDLLVKEEKVRYITLNDSSVFKFRRYGPRWSGMDEETSGEQAWTEVNVYNPNATDTSSTQISKEVEAQLKLSFPTDTDDKEQNEANERKRLRKIAALGATGAHSGTQTLTFFYVSDLLDVVLQAQAQKYADNGPLLTALKSLKNGDTPSAWAAVDFRDEKGQEILDLKIERIKKMGEQLKKLRILLGPLELVHQGTFDSTFASIGDLAVSVKYFIEWLSKKMSDREETYYSLPKFLNDFVNDLLRNILNDPLCFSNQAKQKTRMNQAAVTSYRVSDDRLDEEQKYDEITRNILLYRTPDNSRISRMNSSYYTSDSPNRDFVLPVLNISANRGNPIQEDGIENEMNWLIYYAGRTMPVEHMSGVESDDAKKGIFHYAIGRDRGITKTIKLKKTDTTGLKELRFEQDGYDGLKQLREVFDVDISTYANVHAYPGSYIFVDPKGFSPNSMVGNELLDLTQIGIGGYHMIVRSEHSFGPGYADSTIQAKWVASTEAKVTEGPEGNKNTKHKGEPKYCFDAADRQAKRQKEAKKAQKAETDEAMDKAMGDGSWTSYIPLYNDISNYLDDD